MTTTENNNRNQESVEKFVENFIKVFFYTSYKTTKVILAISIFIFIFETFYPLGNVVKENFGLFGTHVGHAIAIYCWYNLFRFVCLFVDKKANEESK